MDELEAFLTRCIGEDQARAEAMTHFQLPENEYLWCPAALTEPLGDLPFGEECCDCHLAERQQRAFREVSAKRRLLEVADNAYYRADHYTHDEIRHAVASVYVDRTGYREEWRA